LSKLGHFPRKLSRFVGKKPRGKSGSEAAWCGASSRVPGTPAHFDENRREHEKKRSSFEAKWQRHEAGAQAVELEQNVGIEERNVLRSVASRGSGAAKTALVGEGTDSLSASDEGVELSCWGMTCLYPCKLDGEGVGIDAGDVATSEMALDQHGAAAAERIDHKPAVGR
jgi:hypothetical protein